MEKQLTYVQEVDVIKTCGRKKGESLLGLRITWNKNETPEIIFANEFQDNVFRVHTNFQKDGYVHYTKHNGGTFSGDAVCVDIVSLDTEARAEHVGTVHVEVPMNKRLKQTAITEADMDVMLERCADSMCFSIHPFYTCNLVEDK